MRGLTADHILLLAIISIYFVSCNKKWRQAFSISIDSRVAVGVFTIIIIAIATFTSLLRLLFEEGTVSPFVEVARLYGIFRPVLIIMLGAIFIHISFVNEKNKIYELYAHLIVVLGGGAILVGLLQGADFLPLNVILNEFYSRDADFESVIKYGRVFGTFDGQPNVYGTFCSLYILICINRIKSSKSVFIIIPAIIIGGLGLMLSGSRGALLGLLISIIIWLILTRSVKTFFIFFILGVCITLTVFIGKDFVQESLVERLSSAIGISGTQSVSLTSSRLPYWNTIFDLFLDNPFRLLWGLPGNIMPPTDNLQLALMSSLGLPGLLIFMSFLVYIIVLQLKYPNPNSKEFISIIVLMILNGVSYPTFLTGRIGDTFWMIASLILISNFYERVKK
ncbi:O-antigen ligase family protein [Cobetia sp. 14N.309.X.WAT.E.A4]|uniref:O-antigen ligase family protein n=1 Tax=Cobetia sp. 14N.309.X.WAT.E.A4 TaxID=2998323 RepID=UPI0025B23EF0|nr:O-antigen ligase family protein [Cobetia sp. 14N.309.X.WAT.E.A4]MDN2658006.1 O-antigen ligase family protein [Cobetia sp. 14N.309.X.WAT.E.A4]